MANPFDQFDSAPPAAPAKPPGANPFDQFDTPPMPPEHYGFEQQGPKPPAIGPEGLLQYVKDFGSGVYNAFTDNTTHEDLPDIPGAGAGDAALSMLSGIPAAIGAPALAGQRINDGGADASLGGAFQTLTKQPFSRGGAQILDAAGAIFKPLTDTLHGLGQGAGKVAGAFGGSPETQADVGTLVDTIIPNLAGIKGLQAAKGAIPGELPPAVGVGAAGETAAKIRSAGYPLMPSTAARLAQREAPPGVMPSVPNTLTESLVNRGELAGRMGTEGAKNTEGIIRAEFGLPEGTPVTVDMLKGLMRRQNDAYNLVEQALPTLRHTDQVQAAVDQLGATSRDNPYLRNSPEVEALRERLQSIETAPTSKAMEAIRQWREDARTLFQSPDDIAKHELAKQYRSAANALEDGIQAQVDATGNAHIAEQWRTARTIQAKLHNVLDAWSGNELDPQALARLGQDVKLTGGLSDIAHAATHSPETVFSTTGTSISRPSNASWINTPESGLRRFLFEKYFIPRIMSETQQNRYGLAAPRTPNTIAPPVPPNALAYLRSDSVPPEPPFSGLGSGSVDFEPTPPGGPPLAGMAPGVQPGASVGLADALMTDPHGTANPWHGAPEPGQPPAIPEHMGFAPENAHELPSGLGDLLSNEPPPVVDLVQALLGHPDILGPLVEALGVGEGPPGPMSPPRGPRSLKNQRAELNTPTGVARPEEFP